MSIDQVEALDGRFDIYDEDHAAVLHEYMAHARTACPVHRTDAPPGYWIVTRYEDVRRALGTPDVFSSAEGTNVNGQSGVHTPPIDVDPPRHRRYRALLNPFFTPEAVRAHAATMTAVAGRLLDPLIARGSFDVEADFAGPYVAEVLGRAVLEIDDVGLMDEMRHRVHELATTRSADAFRRLHDVMVERCRLDAPRRGGVLAALAAAGTGDGALSEEERTGMALLLFLGGLDTTTAAITNIALRLTESATLEHELRRPGWERALLDELLRLDSPVTGQARVTTRDVEIGGATIPAGSRVLIHLASANRDPDAFDIPDELASSPAGMPHVAFGYGVHHCVGSHLARLQIAIAFGELLARVTRLRRACGAPVTMTPGVVRSPRRLVITFDRLS